MSNQIEQMFNETKSPAEFARAYLKYLTAVFDKISPSEIETFINLLIHARDKGNMVYLS